MFSFLLSCQDRKIYQDEIKKGEKEHRGYVLSLNCICNFESFAVISPGTFSSF